MIPVNLHHCNIFSGFEEKSSSALIRAYSAFIAMLNMFTLECNNCHRRGECICKKVLILMLVGVANIIDTHVVGSGAVLRGAVICFYLSNEGLSLLENAAYLGLPIPDKLREILAQLHERSKKEAEPTDKGEGGQDA